MQGRSGQEVTLCYGGPDSREKVINIKLNARGEEIKRKIPNIELMGLDVMRERKPLTINIDLVR